MQSPNSKYNNAPVSRLGCVVELWIPDNVSDDIPHPFIPQSGVIPLLTLGKGSEPPGRHLQAPLHIYRLCGTIQADDFSVGKISCKEATLLTEQLL